MLSKKIFNSGLKKLAIEYKGLEMAADRTKQWYDYFSKVEDKDFLEGIDECICTCSHVPYMSDVNKSILSVKESNFKYDGKTVVGLDLPIERIWREVKLC